MAEERSESNVYFTRHRKRTMEEQQNMMIDETKEQPEVTAPEKSAACFTTYIGDLKNLDCAICLQTCVHPARLPCGHIFCFLCLKGAAHGNKKCAMCRTRVPPNYFKNPDLLVSSEGVADQQNCGYEWFYEGRQGWWQYDPRTSIEIEAAWKENLSYCELLIAGYLYIIDFVEMCQLRKGQPSKKRRIKRDLIDSEKLGVAGIRDPNAPPRRYSEGDKGSQVDDYDRSETTRRASFETERNPIDFLEDQFSNLSLNNSDDDDSYQ